MILLAMDTSGPVCGIALMQDGQVRYEAMAKNKMTHSENLMPMMEEAFLKTGLELDQVDVFAVTVGPGSFTGVRLGVSAVKALCHAAGKKAVAVDALEATASAARYFDGVICPIQDARAGQVYGAAFEGNTVKRLLDDEPIKVEQFCEKVSGLGKKALFLGDGTLVHEKKITELMGDRAVFAPAHMNFLRPAAVAELAWRKTDEAVDYLTLQPMYLRAPQAEMQKNLKEKFHG
ncbi:MAG: tRNA (adenosine(37)-N6)-threonylcarbamoyltransferase complex dimerization subunit type 1 TsaB [Clostridia bacterium]|nr:tRNA (adenosine(37)-N6)-threonylcarbamoyltransferase complex dimerization subunit type 1 TsaB [Clostridia bacterium]